MIKNRIHELIDMRFLCTIIVVTVSMYNNLKYIAIFSDKMGQKVTPFALPFVLNNPYFLIIFGFCCIYYFSDVPFLTTSQMYLMWRTGKKSWVVNRYLYIFKKSIFLCLSTTLLSIVLLGKHLLFAKDWGIFWETMSISDYPSTMNLNWPVPYNIIAEYYPIEALLICIGMMILISFILGVIMFTVSLYFGKNMGILVVSVLNVMTLVYMNMRSSRGVIKFLKYFIPMEWINISFVDGKITTVYLERKEAILIVFFLMVVTLLVNFWFINRIDMNFGNEE